MERDDIVEYSLYYHHDEAAGKKIRKKIYLVTAIMSIITIIELFVGIVFSKTAVGGIDTTSWQIIKVMYLVLTVIKAGYIVMVFMHLGDEKKALKWVILAPYILFILYLVFICLTEGTYVAWIWENYL
ncbi:MAG: cytochrome C oxidase subunit IV family protein [Bacteroidota bacterium]